MTQDPETILTMLDYAEQQFARSTLYFGHGTDNARDEAFYLLTATLDLPVDRPIEESDRPLTSAEQRHLADLVLRRIEQRIPVAYLTGKAWFCGLPFYVDQRVLIPRSPIAELIEQGFRPWLSTQPHTILDLCAGGGCIGVACAYEFPEASVVLSDISYDALAVAHENISLHNLESRVSAIQSDLFANLGERRFDLIICNPPYVDADDFASMPEEFRHEPELALASGQDGLDFTRRLLMQAESHLSEQGLLIVEVGNSAVALESAYRQVPFTWLEFERGGAGVFLLTRDQLVEHAGALV